MAGWTVVPNGDTSAWKPVASAPTQPPNGPKAGSFMDTVSNVGTHLKNMVAGPYHAFTDAPQPGAEMGIAANPQTGGQLGLGLYRMFAKPSVDAAGTAIDQAKKGNLFTKDEYDAQGNYTPSAFSSAVDAIPVAGPWARNIETEAHQKGAIPALAGLATDTLAPIGAGKLMKAAAPAMQNGGVGIINRTLGATERNFARGKNPGQGYFNEGMGPSMSMGSIARKSGEAKQGVGAQIGSAIDESTASGTRIPSSDFAPKIMKPIHDTRSVLQGPGGGSTEGIDALENTFKPTLSQPSLSPRELFDVKDNVGKNTSWTAANDVGLKQTRQRITGGLSEPLENHVPPLRDLNPRYADVSELNKLATKRADTGVPIMSQIARKGGEAALGGAIGYATHHPLLGLAPLALDTVPARTTIATGLYRGGKLLPAGAKAAPLVGPMANIGGVKKQKPSEEADEK